MSLKQLRLHFQVSALIVKLSSCQFQIQSTSSEAVSAEQIHISFQFSWPSLPQKNKAKTSQLTEFLFYFILLFSEFGSLFQLSRVSDFFLPHNSVV